MSKWLRPGICERPRRVRGVDAVRDTHTVRCPQGAFKVRCSMRGRAIPPNLEASRTAIASLIRRAASSTGSPWRFPGRSLRLETVRRCDAVTLRTVALARESQGTPAAQRRGHRLINPPAWTTHWACGNPRRLCASPSHPLRTSSESHGVSPTGSVALSRQTPPADATVAWCRRRSGSWSPDGIEKIHVAVEE